MDTFSASFSFVLSLVLMVTMGFNSIKFQNKRTDYFTYGRGILLFNLYLNGIPNLLIACNSNDPVVLPSGSPLSCLLYADDEVFFSCSATGLQTSLNIFQQYCKNWKLYVNLKKTKTMNSRNNATNQCLRNIPFFYWLWLYWNAQDYSYLGLAFWANGNLSNSNGILIEKCRCCIFASKSFVDFQKLAIGTCNKLFNTLFKPTLYSSEVWGAYDTLKCDKWEQNPLER